MFISQNLVADLQQLSQSIRSSRTAGHLQSYSTIVKCFHINLQLSSGGTRSAYTMMTLGGSMEKEKLMQSSIVSFGGVMPPKLRVCISSM